jgi:hypothetical protein
MKYSMEKMKKISEGFAEMIQAAVIEQGESEGKKLGIAEIERGMREGLRQIGQASLGQVLSALQATPVGEIGCKCGGKLKYQRKREAKVVSVFGKVSYQRAYYAGCQCREGKAPLDEEYGIEPGGVTAGLAELLAQAGIAFSYEQSAKWLESYLLFEVAANTVRSETERMGELQAETEKEWVKGSQQESDLQERERQPGRIPLQLYGSMDAAKVRTEPRAKPGVAKETHEDWRDMKVLGWYEVERVPTAQQSVRQRKKVQREQPALRAKNMRYFCDIQEAEEFGKLLWATGCRLNADLSPELIFLGDGALWIWNLVAQYYPQAVQILDWFHAEEHLELLAEAAFPDPTLRAAWLEPVTQALWDGQVEEVIAACRSLAPSCLKAEPTANYFANNIERTHYDRFRKSGYMIGSGTIESACKQIVTNRLALPGAQWQVEGAVSTAKARASWLSGDWQSLCRAREAIPLAF